MLIADRYEIIDKLGEGGMGEVYRAMDTRTQTLVAVKHLRQDLNQLDSTLLERFQREGAALRDLNHPNIVKMLDMIQHDKQHYLVMEYIDGGDLADVLRDSGKLPLAKVLQIALELADALTRAHYLNIVHRDLKPANIMMTAAGSPRLTDFGVAHIASQERLTGTGTSVGTLDYLPPEALNGDPVDTRADIWAFGVMLYEMLAGVRPFSGANMSHMINNILREPPPDLRLLRPDVPEMMVELVERMLEKDRDQRIRSVRMVGAELEAIIHGDGASRFTPKTPTPAPVKTDTLALQTPKHLFISYSRDDTDQMTQVRDCLRAEGLEVWTDEGIQPGTPSWQYAIEQAILGAHGMVVLFSPSATASKWVRAELDFAEKQGVPIFPLLVRGDTTNAIPFGYTLYQWIDARKDIENAVSKLIGVLKKVTAETAIGGHTAMMDAPTTAIRRSRLPIFAAAMLAIAVIGIGALLSSGVLQPSVPTPTPTNAPSPTPQIVANSAALPADWELMTLEDSRVLIPTGWAELNSETISAMGLDLLQLDERTQTLFTQITTNGNFVARGEWLELNVVTLANDDMGLRLPIDAVQQRYREFYERMGLPIGDIAVVKLPQGEAIRFQMSYAINENLVMEGTIYILPRGSQAYGIALVSSQSNAEAMRPTFDKVLASWQIQVTEDTPLPNLGITTTNEIFEIVIVEDSQALLPKTWNDLTFDMFGQIGMNLLPPNVEDIPTDLLKSNSFAAKIQWLEFNIAALMVQEWETPLPLDGFKESYVDLFGRIGIAVEISEIVTLPQGETIHIVGSYSTSIPIQSELYVIPRGSKVYVIAFGYSKNRADEMRPIIDTALASWQIGVTDEPPLPTLATPEADSAVIPEGWRRLKGEHTTFAIPPGWIGSAQSNTGMIASAMAMIGGSSEFTEAYSPFINALNIDVLGFHITPERTIFGASIRQPLSDLQVDLETGADFVLTTMEMMSTGTITLTRISNEAVTIQAGEARRLLMNMEFPTRPPLRNLSYILLGEDNAIYGIAFTYFESQSEDVVPQIEQIVETFRIVK